MKTIKRWLCKWLGIDGLRDLTVYNIGEVRDKVDNLEEWSHHTAECHTSNMDRLEDSIKTLECSFNMLFDDVRLLESKQKCDKAGEKIDISHIKDIKDNERRIDRLEQCIYGLSISDDVKAADVKGLVKDMAHQMYGERAARGDDSADYPEEVPF